MIYFEAFSIDDVPAGSRASIHHYTPIDKL